MAYSNNTQKNLQNQEGLTLWLKHKLIKKRDGSEKEVFQGSVDIGGGKMIKVSIDARLYTVDLDVKGQTIPALPIYVSKWKSENRNMSKSNKSW
jgi:hypothetical protein